MKKIVGIMAATAVAVSAFAADVSAATKIKGTLFNYGADKKISVFTEGNDSHDYACPNISFSIADDKAGATVKLTTDGADKAVKMTTQTIWFKPVDALKLTLGTFDVALNKEKIDYTESITGLGGNGYLVSVNTSGFALDAGFTANSGDDGNNPKYWVTKADGADPVVDQFFVKAGYSADFGTIAGFVEFNKFWKNDWEYFKNFTIDPKADSAIQNVMFGAAYANNFNGLDMFVNVVGYMGNKFDWVRPEAYISGSADAFGYSLFAAPLIWVNGDLNKKTECEVVAKLTYKLDSITPYVYFKDVNVLADTFESTIKIGATGSVGAMGWNLWAQIGTGDATTFAVPFELTMNF